MMSTFQCVVCHLHDTAHSNGCLAQLCKAGHCADNWASERKEDREAQHVLGFGWGPASIKATDMMSLGTVYYEQPTSVTED